jgi:ABC-type dipeptide/oligopeptide/nickel transport system permease subunit
MIDRAGLKDFWFSFSLNRGAVFGLVLISIFSFIAIFAPWLAPFAPTEIQNGVFMKPPLWSEGGVAGHWLGTDDVGRDLLSRLIFGTRVSLSVGFLVVIFSSAAGVFLGLCAGYLGGKTDMLIMRVMDLLMSLPALLVALVVITILGQDLTNAVIAVSVTTIPSFVRLVRAQVMSEKKKNYVTASATFGAGAFRQAVFNILPNCMAPLIVQASLSFSDGILSVAALGFLGLGAKAPTPEWGTMLSDARGFIESAPWLVTLPGLCILVVVLGFNLMGDGLRDALDPKLKRA